MFLCTFDRSCLQNPPATLVPVCMSIFRVATAVNSSWLQPASDPGRPISFSRRIPRIPGIFATEFGHCQYLDQFLGLCSFQKNVDILKWIDHEMNKLSNCVSFYRSEDGGLFFDVVLASVNLFRKIPPHHVTVRWFMQVLTRRNKHMNHAFRAKLMTLKQ